MWETTLLNLLSRLESGDCGKIYWDNARNACVKQVFTHGRPIKKGHIFLGVVYQSYYLIPELDVLENVLIAGKLAGFIGKCAIERARYLLSKMGVGDKEKTDTWKIIRWGASESSNRSCFDKLSSIDFS